MSRIRVGISSLSNVIYAGKVTSRGLWCKDKTDVTIEALLSVAQHVLTFGKPVELSKEGGSVEFRITVEDLRKPKEVEKLLNG